MNIEKSINIKLQSIESDTKGEIKGYAAVFDIKDSDNDIIEKTAFTKQIEGGMIGDAIKLLWQHRHDTPIGVITDIKIDDYGILIHAKIAQGIEKGKEAIECIKCGIIDSLSIGFVITDDYMSGEKEARVIREAVILEVSLVTIPAQINAKILGMKAKEKKAEENKVDKVKSELIKLHKAIKNS